MFEIPKLIQGWLAPFKAVLLYWAFP